MGRLPTHYASKRIIGRTPYVMFSEVTLGSTGGAGNPLPFVEQQFPDIDLAFDVDKPFEIHRLIPWAQYLTFSGAVFSPTFDIMALLDTAQVVIRDGAKNVSLTQNPTIMSSLVRGPARQTWEFEDPYYLTRGENLHVGITATPPAIDAGVQSATRYMLAFEGSLVWLEE